MNVILKFNTSTIEEIKQHLCECDGTFIPPLSTRVDLHEFAEKIWSKTVRFEAWDDHRLVGLVGSYFNDPEKQTGFINHVSTLPDYSGQGIAACLLGKCIDYGRGNGFSTIALEVFVGNERAIRLYRRLGFIVSEQNHEVMRMMIRMTPSTCEERQ